MSPLHPQVPYNQGLVIINSYLQIVITHSYTCIYIPCTWISNPRISVKSFPTPFGHPRIDQMTGGDAIMQQEVKVDDTLQGNGSEW